MDNTLDPCDITPLHYAALSTAKQLASYQPPVEENRVAGCLRYVDRGERVLSWLYGWAMGPQWKNHWSKILWVTVSRFSLFQNPSAMSLKVEVYSRLLSSMLKVDFLMRWTVSKWTKYLGIKLIDLTEIHEDFYEIKLLFWSKCVASMYDESLKHVFQPFAFGNKRYFICPQYM